MKNIVALLIILFVSNTLSAQKCNCESNFEWVKKTFEENDAGFEYVLEKKGVQAYKNHNEQITTKIKKAENIAQCSDILYEWLEFFRSGHISIALSNNVQQQNPEIVKTQDFPDWEVYKTDIAKFEKYLKTKKKNDVEGIWYTEPYKIGIKKEKNQYIGFIIESGAETWKKDQLKLKINKNLDSSVYYMRDHSAVTSNNIRLLGENYLKVGNFILKRLSPKLPKDDKIESYIAMTYATQPYLEQINDKTLMIRIPSFRYESKAAIDSVLSANRSLILKTENLIIDIRNGTGGSDSSYNGLIPYLYTNPIRTVGVQYRSTKLNNQRMLDFINKPEYGLPEEDKKWAKLAYEKLEANIGKYMRINQYDVNLTTLDTIHTFPKNVGIVINKGNGSTDEQFLLAAKQSKKVKLFGRTTHGVLDISNMYFIDSPCNEFKLGYALSRSKRIPDFAIDEIGIQPDFYLDDDIPDEQWITHVNEILNN